MNKLPRPYRLGEEIANAITHGFGVFLAVAALVLLVIRAVLYAPEYDRGFYITAYTIFGASMFILYLMSTLYHSLLKTKAGPVFERLDHAAIYLLIAGTYTAYSLTILRDSVGWPIFGIIWGLAVTGIALYAVFGSKLRVASLVTYILMGWIIIFVADTLRDRVTAISWTFLITGGIIYTAGAVVYALKRIRWTHPVWHLFVLGGTILHFLSVYFSLPVTSSM